MKKPVVQLTADNKPLSAELYRRLISLTVTDNKALEADELNITLDDSDGAVALPKRGVTLTVALGYVGEGLQPMGSFVVDGVEWGGTPDTLTIKAKSADFKGTLKGQRSQSYHNQTLGQIAKTVANRHNLTLKIKPNLASLNLGHIDQTDESDINLLTRLCYTYGAVVNIKNGCLLIFTANDNTSVSGKPLSIRTITRQAGDSYRFSIDDRTSDVDNVEASYSDKKQAKKKTVATGTKKTATGKKRRTRKLKGTFKDKKTAKAAATAAAKRIKDNGAKFSLNLAYGYPALTTESPIKLQGFKAEIDKLAWTLDKATHNYTKGGGLTTSVELVAKFA